MKKLILVLDYILMLYSLGMTGLVVGGIVSNKFLDVHGIEH